MVVSDTCLARLVVEAGAAGATPKPTKSFCADSHSSRLRLISAVNADSGTVDKSMSVIFPPSKMFLYQYKVKLFLCSPPRPSRFGCRSNSGYTCWRDMAFDVRL